MENEYSKVKVNNEIDFCSVTEPEGKRPKLPKYIEQGLEWLSKKLG